MTIIIVMFVVVIINSVIIIITILASVEFLIWKSGAWMVSG